MAQINLLKQKTIGASIGEKVPAVLAKVLFVVLLGVAIYYGSLFWSISRVKAEATALESSIAKNKSIAANMAEREELLTRQAQLTQLDTLIAKHPYWSGLLPALAGVTLKEAVYSNLRVSQDGQLNMTVTVPTLEDVEKFLQVFDNPKAYENFSNIRTGAFHKVQSSDPNQTTSVISFDVRMNFNAALLKYNPGQ